jgi:hypothetical protein
MMKELTELLRNINEVPYPGITDETLSHLRNATSFLYYLDDLPKDEFEKVIIRAAKGYSECWDMTIPDNWLPLEFPAFLTLSIARYMEYHREKDGGHVWKKWRTWVDV